MKRNLFKKFVTAAFAAILTLTSITHIPVIPQEPGTGILCGAPNPDPLPYNPEPEIFDE